MNNRLVGYQAAQTDNYKPDSSGGPEYFMRAIANGGTAVPKDLPNPSFPKNLDNYLIH
ncbi:hypothetical protein [Pedobacter jejuensis]|uniref:hypothetical protein n=1 Tax=Pedobacter jejuensis TaxID=1268550 RepID=UPI00142D5A75|nr:hypothetical protein [Pedobacter jejuensis]